MKFVGDITGFSMYQLTQASPIAISVVTGEGDGAWVVYCIPPSLLLLKASVISPK